MVRCLLLLVTAIIDSYRLLPPDLCSHIFGENIVVYDFHVFLLSVCITFWQVPPLISGDGSLLKSGSESHSVMSDSLWPHGQCSPWNSPGQNTGVGSLFLLQGIFPTQGPNPGLPQCMCILYQLSHKGSPRILEWEAYAFCKGSSRPKNWTGVFHIAERFFTNWATREAQIFIGV